jgi:hypothetical protein
MIAVFFLLALAAAQPQTAIQPGPETVVFEIEHGANPLPSFTLTIHSDGTALYQVSYPPEVPKYSPYAATLRAQPPTKATKTVTLSPAGTARIFDRVRSTNGFQAGCASRAKNIADTGAKTLIYTSSAGTATCAYNYADDKTIAFLTREFQGIAETLDEGRRIERDHRYDRLALDSDLQYLLAAANAGDALELGAIAPILHSLVDDPQVLERVRARAAKLLAEAAATP